MSSGETYRVGRRGRENLHNAKNEKISISMGRKLKVGGKDSSSRGGGG